MDTKFKFDEEAVRKLAGILKETDLTEIECEAEGNRIYVSRKIFNNAPSSLSAASFSASPQSSLNSVDQTSQKNISDHPGLIKSPMVGTAYLSSEPGAPSFVKVGDSVSIGQTLLIVEAMKVMNLIKAPLSGKVTQIFAKDAGPVEFDAPLLIIE